VFREQLELLGFEETRRRVLLSGASPAEQARLLRRIESTQELLTELPSAEDIAFMHSGLCQTCLPHSKPESNRDVWQRRSGRFSLTVQPGILEHKKPAGRKAITEAEKEALWVGIPYGPKARLILIYLQSEGLKSRTVSMGASMSAWIRSLGLAVTGGSRGTIAAVREQVLRIARCSFTLQWAAIDGNGGEVLNVTDTRIVDDLSLWTGAEDSSKWSAVVELSERFHTHLKEHAVPLDRRAVAELSGNSLALDLYALFAYRLPRLQKDTLLRWTHLQEQLGCDYPNTRTLAFKVKQTLGQVMDAYPNAKVELSAQGLLLKPSAPAVPKTAVVVRGLALVGKS
jgi:Plasmid encoded RepA protein